MRDLGEFPSSPKARLSFITDTLGAETLLRTLKPEEPVKLFAKNLRSGLGETDINDDICRTALKAPEKFWYFNNGVTFTSEKVSRALLGGASADDVSLSIENGSIVNGAQTTSSLAKVMRDDRGAEALARLKCLVRVVEIPRENSDFSTDVTRYNNSQNGIGVKDFVSLDPFQQDLRRGLDREFAVNYIIRSGEESHDEQVPSITLQEATIALVACGKSIENAVRAKDKISSLWRDTEATPYLEIFSRERVTPLSLYKSVSANRAVENFLKDRISNVPTARRNEKWEKERAIATHGNRLFAFYILRNADITREQQSIDNFRQQLDLMKLSRPFEEFVGQVFDRFGASYKAPLFKNRGKCAEILAHLPSFRLPF